MTAAEIKELGQIRVEYITQRENSLSRQLSSAERELLDVVLAKFITQFSENNGKITYDGNPIKLTQALDKIVDSFMSNENMQIVRSYISGLATIGDLNHNYFKEVAGKRATEIRDGANEFMRQHIGLSADNKLKKGGFLDSFVNDPFLKSSLKSYTINALKGGMPQSDFVKGLRNLIVTSPDGTGLLSKHYQTFAYDTMSQYDRAIGNQYRVRLGLRYAIYAGGLIADSRDFCIDKNNLVFTTEEMETEWPKDPKLLKTKKETESGSLIGYNPLIDLGRWRCRHTLNWISQELAEKLRPDLKQVIPPEISAQKDLTLEQAKKAMKELNLTQTEKDALKTYTGGGYAQINGFQRGLRKTITDEAKQTAAVLDDFLNKAPKVTEKSFRGISLSQEEFDKLKVLKKGDYYTDKGFMSTSYDNTEIDRFLANQQWQVSLEIRGKNGVLIENFSDLSKEKEILFGRNSRFEIQSIKTKEKAGSFGKITISLKEI